MNPLNPVVSEFLVKWNASKVSFPGSVYEPAEDSHLMLDSLSSLSSLSPGERTLLDMGTGSGIVGIFAAFLGVSRVVSTDINPEALTCARNNARALGMEPERSEYVRSDLFSGISPHVSFDIITFNPPYLPLENGNVHGTSYSPDGLMYNHEAHGDEWCLNPEGSISALDGGGPDGTVVLRRFLEDFHGFLEDGGSAYVIISSLNNLTAIEDHVRELYGPEVEWKILSQRGFFFERIYCIELHKSPGI